jgi:hypothetical protein
MTDNRQTVAEIRLRDANTLLEAAWSTHLDGGLPVASLLLFLEAAFAHLLAMAHKGGVALPPGASLEACAEHMVAQGAIEPLSGNQRMNLQTIDRVAAAFHSPAPDDPRPTGARVPMSDIGAARLASNYLGGWAIILIEGRARRVGRQNSSPE